MKGKINVIFLSLGLATLWLLFGQPNMAYADDITVCKPGTGTCDYNTVQEAVDASTHPTDVIKVANGVYTGTQSRPAPPGYEGAQVVTQVVYLSKTLTIRGGYTATNNFADPPDPIANPTTIDAQGQGRALFIAGQISPTVEGLRFVGGDAAGLGGLMGIDMGGGLYIIDAWATISRSQIVSNTSRFGAGLFETSGEVILASNIISDNMASFSGGGLFLWDSSTIILSDNTIAANSAITTGGGLYMQYIDNAILTENIFTANTANWAGGLAMFYSSSTLVSNTISANTGGYLGGGLYLLDSSGTVRGNTIVSNTVTQWGGGVFLWDSSSVTLNGNIISTNTANSHGGGLYLRNSPATLSGNTVISNSSNYNGGGLYLQNSPALFNDNAIISNMANGLGGGLYLSGSDATLNGNTVISNTANGYGGGLYLSGSDAALTNNIVADNQAGDTGSGLHISYSSPTLRHNTIACNTGGDGSGLYLYGSSTVATLVNTILISHTVGISVATNATADLEATLWGNQTDWGGDGVIVTGTVNVWGNPAFADPDDGDYHIAPSSAAVDAGVNAGVITDIDGHPRPSGVGYDIGADEFAFGLNIAKHAYPDLVQSGAQLTYTLRVTNTSNLTLTAIITDILPAQVSPTGTLTWVLQLPAPGGVWTQTLVVTVDAGYAGPLVNVIQARAEGDPTIVTTRTVTAQVPVTDLSAANDSPTLLGQATTLTATVAAGEPVFYQWAFGDGDTGSGAVVSHTYPNVGVYTAVVTAGNDVSLLSTTTAVTVLQPCDSVTATAFVWTPITPTVGEVVTFAGSATGTLPITFTWDLGDGNVGTGQVVTRSYAVAGSYAVSLTTTNCQTATDTVAHTLNVVAAPPVCTPVTDTQFVWTPITPTVGEMVTFSGSATGTLPITFTWDLGDGNTEMGRVITHNYATAGSYAVILTATNCTDASITDTHTISIIAAPVCTQVTGVDLTQTTTGTIYPDDEVVFSADIAPDEATKPYTYTIYVDGTTLIYPQSGSDDPLGFSHTFPNTGAHQVEIQAWNCEMSEPVTDVVELIVYKPSGCVEVSGVDLSLLTVGDIHPGDRVGFSADLVPNGVSLPYTYTIDYGDGTEPSTATGSTNPLLLTHTYTTASIFTAEIAVWNCAMPPTEAITDTVEVNIIEPNYLIYLPIVLKND